MSLRNAGIAQPACAEDAAYTAVAGPMDCAIDEVVWRDEARGRTIKSRAFVPEDEKGPLPLVLFSPGLGGSHRDYTYLGKAWAAHGYVVVTSIIRAAIATSSSRAAMAMRCSRGGSIPRGSPWPATPMAPIPP